MTPEQPHHHPALPLADTEDTGEIPALLDAVERDVASGKPVADAVRERLGLVFSEPVSEDKRMPVDLELLREFVSGSLSPEEQERVYRLTWADPQWVVAYLKIVLEKYPGSRPELLDRLRTQKPA